MQLAEAVQRHLQHLHDQEHPRAHPPDRVHPLQSHPQLRLREEPGAVALPPGDRGRGTDQVARRGAPL